LRANVYFDGGCAPTNPGHAGFAVVVKYPGRRTRVLSRYLGIHTNNYAEYTGLITAVKYASELGYDQVKIHSDSLLVVNQINGLWKVKSAEIRPLREKAYQWLYGEYLGWWELVWVPRKKNALADHYCTLAINHGRGIKPGKILDKGSRVF